MDRIFNLFIATACAVLALVGCEEAGNSGVKPQIKLVEGTVTENSLSFIMGVSDATECAYMLYDGDVTTVKEIFSEGTVVNGNGGMFTIGNLKGGTKYYVVAAARNAAGEVMSNTLVMTTKGSASGPDNPPIPDNPDAKTLNIVKTKDGRWYSETNYYVTLVADSGEEVVLDFYTIRETMSCYLPYGSYNVGAGTDSYTISAESSAIFPSPEDDTCYYFTEGYCNVDVVDGYYALYLSLSYQVDGVTHAIQAYYNGLLSGASVPKGDDNGADKLIEVLEVGSTSFQFRINAEVGQYWRCSVVDKRVYDQTASNPGAWVVTYGFMLDGTRTFNWENGKMCEHVPGLEMSVTSSTDYIILAALMDYSEGQENSLLGGVEIVQIHTEADKAGSGSVEVTIKEINANDITFDCIFSDDVWCCYVAILETADLQEIKDGKYTVAGYSSYEECMLSLIPGLSHSFMRQFLESQYDYKWDALKYKTSYTMCIKVEDMDKGVTFIELEPFNTL